MSLQPSLDTGVPSEIATVAHAAFPRDHAYRRLRDALGPIYADALFTGQFAHDRQPAACPWRLALVTLLQFAENLSDRRAASPSNGSIGSTPASCSDRLESCLPPRPKHATLLRLSKMQAQAA